MPPAIMLSCINFFCLAGFTAFCNASCVEACMERAVEVFKARSGWSEAALRPQSTPAEKQVEEPCRGISLRSIVSVLL